MRGKTLITLALAGGLLAAVAVLAVVVFYIRDLTSDGSDALDLSPTPSIASLPISLPSVTPTPEPTRGPLPTRTPRPRPSPTPTPEADYLHTDEIGGEEINGRPLSSPEGLALDLFGKIYIPLPVHRHGPG